jgi:pimeloyl-ACP methyl ester carboxylesterase
MPVPFRDWGGDGPLLHFSHANAYPPGVYRRFLQRFTPEYHVLTALHRPLWPESDPRRLTHWGELADDLIRFCDEYGIRDALGAGHSLGAVATMMAAIRRPELFSRLILIEPVFLPEDTLKEMATVPVEKMEQLSPLSQGALRRRSRWPQRDAAFDHYRSKSVFAGFSDAVLRDYVDEGLREDEQGLTLAFPPAWEARIYATPPAEVWELIPRIPQPTLAIRGATSTTLRPPQWARWQTLQPGATFVEMPGVGHLLTFEAPAAVAGTIRNWIK